MEHYRSSNSIVKASKWFHSTVHLLILHFLNYLGVLPFSTCQFALILAMTLEFKSFLLPLQFNLISHHALELFILKSISFIFPLQVIRIVPSQLYLSQLNGLLQQFSMCFSIIVFVTPSRLILAAASTKNCHFLYAMYCFDRLVILCWFQFQLGYLKVKLSFELIPFSFLEIDLQKRPTMGFIAAKICNINGLCCDWRSV